MDEEELVRKNRLRLKQLEKKLYATTRRGVYAEIVASKSPLARAQPGRARGAPAAHR
jgi:hypothetical protein